MPSSVAIERRPDACPYDARVRNRVTLAVLLLACLPVLQACTAATYGATSVAKDGDRLVVILRQCARESDDITLDEVDKDGNYLRTVGHWKPRAPIEATRTVTFPLDVDPNPDNWNTIKSFAGVKMEPGHFYSFWSSGPNNNGNAPGSTMAFSASDVERMKPGTVLDDKYTYGEKNEADIITVVVKPLPKWTKDVDALCDGNGWFS